MQEMNPVAIDNDFLVHLLDIKKHPDLEQLIKRFFAALQVQVSMHPMVYQYETAILKNPLCAKLLADSTISIVQLDAIWAGKPGGKRYYSMMVQEIYKDFTGKKYPLPDVLGNWKAQCSLGEVHTVVMCAFLLWDCFLSDDNEAASKLQVIVQNKLNWEVNIFSRKNRCESLKIVDPSQRQGLTSSELKKLAHSRT